MVDLIFVEDEILDHAKCTEPYVMNVDVIVKFLLDQVEASQYFVVIVLKGKKEEGVQEDQKEEVLGDLEEEVTLEDEIIIMVGTGSFRNR